uniref:Protein FAM194B n=1 Tax=Schistosoma haematobium TaxID=6185 RepID=A0A094ZI46_SCHHA
METEYYSILCYDGVERTFKCQSTQTREEDMYIPFEVDSDIVAVTSEGTEDIDILGDEYTENREENEIMDFDNMRKSVSFRKTPVELIAPAKYVDDEYGVESAPESSSDKEEYPTKEEYTNREWINKPISNWINYAYVNIPNSLDKVDNFKSVKNEQNVVKDICCRNNQEQLKLSSLAQTYAKRIAIADGSKNCKFCGRILSSTLTKPFHLSNEGYCCDRYHRLFRLAVSYSEMLYKRYRQQRRDHNRQKSNNLTEDASENQVNESGTKISGSETELLILMSKTLFDTYDESWKLKYALELNFRVYDLSLGSLADTTGNTNNDDNEETEYTTDRIVYQLSNRKYIEQGWTAVNHVQHSDNDNNNDELLLVNEGKSMHINSDEVKHESIEIQLDFIQHTYSNGEIFLRKYNDNTGVIFYPTGNPAILFLPSEMNTNNNEPVGLLFIVHDLLHLNMTKVRKEDTKINHKQKSNSFKVLNNNTSKMNKLINVDVQSTVGQLIGVFDSNIHGVVYDKENNIRLQYNHNEGVYFKQLLDRYTKIWKWSGEKHVHAPPFQPMSIKLNDIITLKIYRFNKIHLHFQTMKIICKLDLTSKQLKLQWINTEQYKEPK